ncbi:hypothetical protein CERSUDRAFT_139425 [Gelatoporia subvermispora B]|uniref:Uncharacterized protein n=1 Tax=Ceriporiopsis subvermispora (strain B) TaxID=914234 RepID=M2R9Y3_CERS8|nr:hypothetical protein CERSUDRAFT_139425 [Gelatoporia subvermispora B]
MLQRPLGVHDRPVAERQTWSKMAEEMLDEEKRLEKRKHLIKAATKGYYTDLLATRKFAGKTWIAPKVMIRADKALYFPNMYGTALTGAKVHTTDLCQGKVSIIAVLCTRMSEIQTANFVKEAHELHQNNPMYQFIQINLQENLLRSLLVSLFTSGIKKSVPESLWPTYLVSNQNMDYIRDDLGMTNRHIGYVYLVDEQCRVRWAGCADPRPEESAALSVCASVLLKRHETPKKA